MHILLYVKQQRICVSLLGRLNWVFDDVPTIENHEPCSASRNPRPAKIQDG